MLSLQPPRHIPQPRPPRSPRLSGDTVGLVRVARGRARLVLSTSGRSLFALLPSPFEGRRLSRFDGPNELEGRSCAKMRRNSDFEDFGVAGGR